MKSKVKEFMAGKPDSGTAATTTVSKDNKEDKPDTSKKLKKSVGFGGHVNGISFHVDGELEKLDSQLFLDDNGSNTDIVNDESLLVHVHPLDMYVNGVGSAKVTGIGVFVGKSINRDGSEIPIARKRVLVCPTFSRNIIGTSVLQRRDDVVFNRQCKEPHMLAIMGDEEDDILTYDLHDNPQDSTDPFLYFQLAPVDESDFTEEQEEFAKAASQANLKEIRGLQARVYQTELKKEKKKTVTLTAKKRVHFEPAPTVAEEKEISRVEKAVAHAHTRREASAVKPAIRRVRKEDMVDDVAVRASINESTTVGEVMEDKH